MSTVFKNIAFIGLFFIAICINLLHTSCGQRGVPTGGKKDTIPPQIVASYPGNYSTGFTGTKITLQFDEYVQVKSFSKEFLISPPVATAPSATLKGKKLILEFDTTLNENTTYSMYLGEAIVDLNEGNPLDSNLFVFSTGSFIDSLTLKGKITEAYTGEAAEDILVHLYKNLNDTAPQTELPSYFAQAKDGRFNFSNLAEGSYKIFALRDVNRNYKFDLPEEEIAFDTSVIVLPFNQDSSPPIRLKIFNSELENQRLFKPISPKNTAILLSFAKGVSDEKLVYNFIDSAHKDCQPIEIWNDNKDTLTLFSERFEAGQRVLMNIRLDTFKLDSAKIKINKEGGEFSFKSNFKSGFGGNFNEPFKFMFELPVKDYCKSCFTVVKDSTDTLKPQLKKMSDHEFQLQLGFQESTSYELLVDSGAFTSVLNQQTNEVKYDLPMLQAARLGNLKVIFEQLPKGKYLIELWSEKRVEQQLAFTSGDEVSFMGVAAGDYYLKLIEDKDGNGKWSTGNYFDKIQAERVIPYPQKVEIRANWDMDLNWKFE